MTIPDDMPPHQKRVVEEFNELGDKIVKLAAFIRQNPIFKGLPLDEQMRLRTQEFLMNQYWMILRSRIDHFTSE